MISCPAGSPGQGPHAIGGSVKDNVNHVTRIYGGFFIPCSGDKPGLSVEKQLAYWPSYADYQMRRLAVTCKRSNAGPDADGVMIPGGSNSAGVTMFTQILGVDNLAGGANTPTHAVIQRSPGRFSIHDIHQRQRQ